MFSDTRVTACLFAPVIAMPFRAGALVGLRSRVESFRIERSIHCRTGFGINICVECLSGILVYAHGGAHSPLSRNSSEKGGSDTAVNRLLNATICVPIETYD